MYVYICILYICKCEILVRFCHKVVESAIFRSATEPRCSCVTHCSIVPGLTKKTSISFINIITFKCDTIIPAFSLLRNIFSALLLVHSHSVHLSHTVLDIGGAISKFATVLWCMRNITPGGSDMREAGMNTMQKELHTCMWDLSRIYIGMRTERERGMRKGCECLM